MTCHRVKPKIKKCVYLHYRQLKRKLTLEMFCIAANPVLEAPRRRRYLESSGKNLVRLTHLLDSYSKWSSNFRTFFLTMPIFFVSMNTAFSWVEDKYVVSFLSNKYFLFLFSRVQTYPGSQFWIHNTIPLSLYRAEWLLIIGSTKKRTISWGFYYIFSINMTIILMHLHTHFL